MPKNAYCFEKSCKIAAAPGAPPPIPCWPPAIEVAAPGPRVVTPNY